MADDENQLKVQAFAVPDVAAVAFRRFSTCLRRLSIRSSMSSRGRHSSLATT